MRKILYGLLLLLIIGIVPVSAKEKVKVYVFEAGGCPYCIKQIEYFEGLDGYNKTFEVIKKELYVDHVDWNVGKDYPLGKKVAEVFYNEGFTDASSNGTPFVVISNIYAASMYNPSLESIIDKAYKEGDKDVVGCLEKNRNCDVDKFFDYDDYDDDYDYDDDDDDTYDNTDAMIIDDNNSSKKDNNTLLIALIIIESIVIVGLLITVIVLCTKIKNLKINNMILQYQNSKKINNKKEKNEK